MPITDHPPPRRAVAPRFPHPLAILQVGPSGPPPPRSTVARPSRLFHGRPPSGLPLGRVRLVIAWRRAVLVDRIGRRIDDNGCILPLPLLDPLAHRICVITAKRFGSFGALRRVRAVTDLRRPARSGRVRWHLRPWRRDKSGGARQQRRRRHRWEGFLCRGAGDGGVGKLDMRPGLGD